MQKEVKRSFVLHPFLFAIFPVIFAYAHNVNYLPISEIIIPIGIYLGIATILWLIIRFPLNGKKSGLIVSLALVLFFTYGHLYIFLNYDSSIESDLIKHRFLLPLFVGTLIAGIVYFVRTKRKLNNLTTMINGVAITIILFSLVNIGTFYLERDEFLDNNEIIVQDIDLVKNEKLPNVYFLILDGYTSEKILKNIYAFDNSKFIEFLKNNEFFIPENAHSNYAKSSLSITSTLEMNHLTYLEEVAANSKDEVQLGHMIPRNNVMTVFKNAGYDIVNFDSGTGKNTRNISDIFLCTNNTITNSEFIVELARTSILHPIYTKIFVGDHRETILCMFSEIPEVNNKTDKPMFVFAHFILPHPPFTFGPNGESINPESLELGNNNWKNKEGYLNQVEFANNETQLIIEKILSYDDNSIIIIQGDHGSQFTMNWDDPNIDMINERMSILNSIYFPNEDKQFLYDSITPVNTFRVVFNTYLNGTYSYVDDKQYFSTYDQPFVFDDVTDKLQ